MGRGRKVPKMQSMQAKVLDRIEMIALDQGLDTAVNYGVANNVGNITVLGPNLQALAVIEFDFQAEYMRASVVRAGERIKERDRASYAYAPETWSNNPRTLSDLLDRIRTAIDAAKAEVVNA